MASFGSGHDAGVGLEGGFADGERLDAVAQHLEASAGGVGHGDLALGAYGDGGLDDVLVPVAAGGGDIAGEREVGQRGERDVVRAADAGLKHTAAPDGNATLGGGVVHGDGLA